MQDQEVEDAGLETTAGDVQAPQVPTATPAPGYTPLELDEIEILVRAAFVTKRNPTPIMHDNKSWLTSGYYRSVHALKCVAWLLTDKGGTDHQQTINRYGRTWWLTNHSVIVTFGSDEAYEQLTMEALSNGE